MLYDASATLTAPPDKLFGNSTSTKMLLDRWSDQSAKCFEELTFHAICLRFSLLLTNPGGGCDLKNDLLANICSWTSDLDAMNLYGAFAVRQGPLHRTTAVANFPTLFMDMFSDGDAIEQKQKYCYERAKIVAATASAPELTTLVNALYPVPAENAVKSSLASIRTLLAQQEHFCFMPRNPNNQGEDSVIFLAREGCDLEWVVVLLQNKRWWPDGAVEKWRGTKEDLPPAMQDVNGKTHKLRYVRMLVTANTPGPHQFTGAQAIPAEASSPAKEELDGAKAVPANAQHRAFNAAYAALGHGSPTVTDVSEAAEEWSRKWCAANYPLSSNAAGKPNYLSVKARAAFLETYFGNQPEHADVPKADVWECATDIAAINKWCPTVGLYMNNVAQLHNIGAVALQSTQ
jgi:hypothetical protein